MIELIPAIDIIDGKCVRLSQGDYSQQKIYNEYPLEVAKAFEDHGIKRLHVVDLDGAKSAHIVNYKILELLASNTSLTIDFGGGIKNREAVHVAFESGADMITLGSVAVTQPELFKQILQQYGNNKVILGADVKDNKVAINGWKENSTMQLDNFLTNYLSFGVKKVICTDIAQDGMLQGPSIDLYKSILEKHNDCHLIASGGVSSLQDLLTLNEAHIPAVIFGKAIYEGRISLKEIKKLIYNAS